MTEQLEMVEVRKIDPALLVSEHIQSWVAMEVYDDSSQKICGERMDLLYRQKEKLKADRDSIVRPLRSAIKATDELANPVLKPLQDAYDALNAKLGVYVEKKRRREEAEKKAAQEAEAARIKTEADRNASEAVETGDERKFAEAAQQEASAVAIAAAPVSAPQKTMTQSGAKFIPVTLWHARVIDAAKIPREFLIVDLVRLQKYATAMREKGNVPGVEFYTETMNRRM